MRKRQIRHKKVKIKYKKMKETNTEVIIFTPEAFLNNKRIS